MRWLRRGTLVISIVIGLSVLALLIHTYWLGSPDDPANLERRVRDLQLLVIILLAWSGVYTVFFLLSPIMIENILKQQNEQLVKTARSQLSGSVRESPDPGDEARQVTSGQVKAIREVRTEIAPALRPALEASRPAPGESAINERDYLHLSAGLSNVSNGMVQIYEAMASSCAPDDHAAARSYLNRALRLSTDPIAAAEIHYSLACLLARQGELGDALIELQTAFMNKSPDLELRLANDMEEGGPLHEMATREPYDRVLDDLLLGVTIGT